MRAWGKSWGFAWGNAWGLLQTPYVDLSGAERVYVRSVLDRTWSQRTVEQVLSVATINRISVLDAATVLRVVDVSTTGQLELAARNTVVEDEEGPLHTRTKVDSITVRSPRTEALLTRSDQA